MLWFINIYVSLFYLICVPNNKGLKKYSNGVGMDRINSVWIQLTESHHLIFSCKLLIICQ